MYEVADETAHWYVCYLKYIATLLLLNLIHPNCTSTLPADPDKANAQQLADDIYQIATAALHDGVHVRLGERLTR